MTTPTVPVQSETRWGYIAEATAGTTPATPAFQLIRPRAGSVLKVNRPRTESSELRPDRKLGSTYGGIGGGSGTIKTLLFHETFQHDMLAMAMCGAWATDVLTDGLLALPKTFERRFNAGSNLIFDRLKGGQVDKLALSVIPNQETTVDYTLTSLGGVSDSAIISGATYVAADTSEPADYADVSNISAFGLTNFSLTQIDLAIANNLDGQPKLGSRDLKGIGLGKSRITGSLRMYLDDPAYYAAALANAAGEVEFTIGHADGSRYIFTIPNAEIGDNGADDSTGDGILMINFTAKFDSDSGAQMAVTRNAT
jgi:hypothetical protein